MSEVFDDPSDGHVNPDDLPTGDPDDIPHPDDDAQGGVPVGSGATNPGRLAA